ncbi:MAG: hypothetical protein LBS29_00335 [Endomicrobium sp.]|nr:hypothetical protein [Endomicrobium sp.]
MKEFFYKINELKKRKMENNEIKEVELPSSLENEARRKTIYHLVEQIYTVCQEKHLSIKAFGLTASVGLMIREHFLTKNEQKYYDELFYKWELNKK